MRKVGMMRKVGRGGGNMGGNKGIVGTRHAIQTKARQNISSSSSANAQMRMMQQNSRRDMASLNNMGSGSGIPPPYMVPTELNNFEHLSPYVIGSDGGCAPSAPPTTIFNCENRGLAITPENNEQRVSNMNETIPEYADIFKKIIPLKRATKCITLAVIISTCALVIILIYFL